MAINNTVATPTGQPTNTPNLSYTQYANGNVSFIPASAAGINAGEPDSATYNPGYSFTTSSYSGFNPPAGNALSTFTQNTTQGTYANPISVSSVADIPQATNQYYSVNGTTYPPGSLTTTSAPSSYSSSAAQENNNQIQTQVQGYQTQQPYLSTVSASTAPTYSPITSSSNTTSASNTGETTGTTGETGTYQLSNGQYYSYTGQNNPPPSGSTFVSGQTNPDLAQFDINTSENQEDAQAQLSSLTQGLQSYNTAISQILAGTFPLNPYQSSVVSSMQNVFNSTMQIAQQNVQSYTSYVSAMGARTGGQYSPGATASFVAAATNWGATQLSYIGAQQGQAIAQVEQGFMQDDFNMVQNAYSQFLSTNQAQSSIINNLHTLTLQANQDTIQDNVAITQLQNSSWTGSTDAYGNPVEFNALTHTWVYPPNAIGTGLGGTVTAGGDATANMPGYNASAETAVTNSGGNYGTWIDALGSALGDTATPPQVTKLSVQLNGDLSSGDFDAAQQDLINLAKTSGVITSTDQQTLSGATQITQDVQPVIQALQAYEAKYGSTNPISGTISQILQNKGISETPEGSKLISELGAFTTQFAHDWFGARITDAERSQLSTFVPSPSNMAAINVADIQSMFDLMNANTEGVLVNAFGQDAYDNIWGDNSPTTQTQTGLAGIFSAPTGPTTTSVGSPGATTGTSSQQMGATEGTSVTTSIGSINTNW